MKVAFASKGSSGKTTLTSLFAAYLVHTGHPVLAIDADTNQHLGSVWAREKEAVKLPTLGEHLALIKDYLRGDNPLIADANAMIKPPPPGRGSRLVRPFERNPLMRACFREIGGVDSA